MTSPRQDNLHPPHPRQDPRQDKVTQDKPKTRKIQDTLVMGHPRQNPRQEFLVFVLSWVSLSCLGSCLVCNPNLCLVLCLGWPMKLKNSRLYTPVLRRTILPEARISLCYSFVMSRILHRYYEGESFLKREFSLSSYFVKWWLGSWN